MVKTVMAEGEHWQKPNLHGKKNVSRFMKQ